MSRPSGTKSTSFWAGCSCTDNRTGRAGRSRNARGPGLVTELQQKNRAGDFAYPVSGWTREELSTRGTCRLYSGAAST